jgi:hypothetical protein
LRKASQNKARSSSFAPVLFASAALKNPFLVLFGAGQLMPLPVDAFVLSLGEGLPQDRFNAMEQITGGTNGAHKSKDNVRVV